AVERPWPVGPRNSGQQSLAADAVAEIKSASGSSSNITRSALFMEVPQRTGGANCSRARLSSPKPRPKTTTKTIVSHAAAVADGSNGSIESTTKSARAVSPLAGRSPKSGLRWTESGQAFVVSGKQPRQALKGNLMRLAFFVTASDEKNSP